MSGIRPFWNEILKVWDSTLGEPVELKSTNGAAHVKVNDAVAASTYNSDKTVNTTTANEAIPSGAKSLYVYNQGATNFMRFRFGTDNTVTATVSTGFFLDPGDSIQVPIPSGATYWAYIADTAAVTAAVVWGG